MSAPRVTMLLASILMVAGTAVAQSPSFDVYVNPIIPGDHPDPTLTRIGDYFYTSGSSFNPTPRIYRSTDLVHWEVIAQPLATWSGYGNSPAGGAWGGHTVYHHGLYWHFFGHGSNMYFVTAHDPAGPWGAPMRVNVPAGVPGLGRDNSIFIDDDGRWYLLVKNGEENNFIVELGANGQPEGEILDLRWLNPQSEGLPYGWAEGPVMWKHGGYYYYSFAQHLAGVQYVMWSETLTDDPEAWSDVVLLYEQVPNRGSRRFPDPNHSTPAVTLDDGTSWLISHAYLSGINGEWMGQGRQPVLSQITYEADGRPVAAFPSDEAVPAPALPSGGVPWMVPKSDFFDAERLNPEWSFLGYTAPDRYSLTEREGWLRLKTARTGITTVIKNDAEHNYSVITRLDFEPGPTQSEAGIWVLNGLQTLIARLRSTLDAGGTPILSFDFDGTEYTVENEVGNVVWLKLERDAHVLTGYYSADGDAWTQLGQPINVLPIDRNQPDFGAFTGTRQGLYVRNGEADFDLYIYRDAYSRIRARFPANFNGVAPRSSYLGTIDDGDWAMYAGVEFGRANTPPGSDYRRRADSVHVSAASVAEGGTIEIWADSIETGTLVAEVPIGPTGSMTTFATFSAPVSEIEGRHDLYLRFRGTSGGELFRLSQFQFSSEPESGTNVEGPRPNLPQQDLLGQNYPNPFWATTQIRYTLSEPGHVRLTVHDVLGREVMRLVDRSDAAGSYTVALDGSALPSGVYLYRLETKDQVNVRTMTLVGASETGSR